MITNIVAMTIITMSMASTVIMSTITIMGIDEADSLQGQVSWISPIARTLIKAREGDSVLFSGDLAMHKLFPAFATPQSRLGSWLTSLDALDALRAKQVIGAHYGMSDASMIGAYRGFLTALRGRVAEMKKQGKSSDETATTLRTIHARWRSLDVAFMTDRHHHRLFGD